MPHKVITVWIAAHAKDAMTAAAERMFPQETGGVLLGYWAATGTEVVITHIVGAGPAAVHHERKFVPDAGYQEREIAEMYAASGRRIVYLGDWHTHPRSTAYLSRQDRRTLQCIAQHAEARAPMPLMAVLAGGAPWTLGIWLLKPSNTFRMLGHKLVPLHVINFEEQSDQI